MDIAVYTMARCILYPGTKVVITSSTKKQAGLIISAYCIPMIMNHPNINREILSYTANNNTYEVRFKNGSFITVVVSGESGRGNRSNINVLEERRLIPNDVIQGIIRPFMVSRKPPYMMNPKYSNIQELKDAEEPQEIIITSAHYKSTEWYPEAVKFLKDISEGDENKKSNIFRLSYYSRAWYKNPITNARRKRARRPHYISDGVWEYSIRVF